MLTAGVRVVWQQSRDFCQMGRDLDPPTSARTPHLMPVMHCAHSAVDSTHLDLSANDENRRIGSGLFTSDEEFFRRASSCSGSSVANLKEGSWN